MDIKIHALLQKNVTFQNGYFSILRIIYTSEVVVYHV